MQYTKMSTTVLVRPRPEVSKRSWADSNERVTLLRLGRPFLLTQSHFRPPMQGTRDRAFSLKPWQRRNQLYSTRHGLCPSLFNYNNFQAERNCRDDVSELSLVLLWLLDFASSVPSTEHTTTRNFIIHESQTKHKIIGESSGNRSPRFRFR